MISYIFWQISLSPHMHHIYKELASLGASVSVVTYKQLSSSRTQLGWTDPLVEGYTHISFDTARDYLNFHGDSLLDFNSIHIYQGLYADSVLRRCLSMRRSGDLAFKVGVLSEPPNLHGFMGSIRRFIFRLKLRKFSRNCSLFILALGGSSSYWKYLLKGIDASFLCFGYYSIPKSNYSIFANPVFNKISLSHISDTSGVMPSSLKITFVGQFIHRKNVLVLAKTLGAINGLELVPIQIHLAGIGPLLNKTLNVLSQMNVNFVYHGALDNKYIHILLHSTDVLILPSFYDGWGMVVEEALCSGCRVIVSDGCGIHVHTEAFNKSYTFSNNTANDLKFKILLAADHGLVTSQERFETATKARSLFSAARHAQRLIRYNKSIFGLSC